MEGEEAFDDFYDEIYGKRWPSLKEALLEEGEKTAYDRGLKKAYLMDDASINVAMLLPLSEDDRVLDMCAAPGGKSLVLASRLGPGGSLVSNDRSRDRKIRMDRVFQEHLDDETLSRVKTSCRDASKWGLHEKDAYDAILLDAPCSSERHVLHSSAHLSIWSPKRPKRLAIEQYALLSSAFMAVRQGGYILYSTCSINPAEDEAVIERLMKKKEGLVEEVDFDIKHGEKRSHGIIVMPDTSGGSGPMYCCLLRKLS